MLLLLSDFIKPSCSQFWSISFGCKNSTVLFKYSELFMDENVSLMLANEAGSISLFWLRA